MIILLLFNEMQFNLELLLASFHNLLKLKILICDKETDKINESSTVRILEDFRKYVITLFNSFS
jgi:hypothetical protein